VDITTETTSTTTTAVIDKKVDSVTKSYKPFINKIKNLSSKNPENAYNIYDYIIAEQTDF
jgi:hypothetical protein